MARRERILCAIRFGSANQTCGSEGVEFLLGEFEVGRSGRVEDALGAAGSGNGDHDRGLGQLPGETDLVRRDAVGGGDLGEGDVPATERPRPADAAEGRPRQEGDAELGTQLELRLAGAKPRRELVLDAGQAAAQDLAGDPDLVGVGVRDAGQPDLAGVEQVAQRPDGVLIWHLRVRPVVLIQADGLDAERLERALAGRLDVVGPPVDRPAAAGRAGMAALGRHEHRVAITAPPAERRGDEPFVVTHVGVVGGVGIRRVDQRDARVERGVDRPDRLGLVGQVTTNGHRHGAEADRRNGDIANGSCLHETHPSREVSVDLMPAGRDRPPGPRRWNGPVPRSRAGPPGTSTKGVSRCLPPAWPRARRRAARAAWPGPRRGWPGRLRRCAVPSRRPDGSCRARSSAGRAGWRSPFRPGNRTEGSPTGRGPRRRWQSWGASHARWRSRTRPRLGARPPPARPLPSVPLRRGSLGWRCHYPRTTPRFLPAASQARKTGVTDPAAVRPERAQAPLALNSRPSTTMAANQMTPVPMVRRSRLRSTTEDPPGDEGIPPPNRSDRPPPLPLWRRTSSTISALVTMSTMEVAMITAGQCLLVCAGSL